MNRNLRAWVLLYSMLMAIVVVAGLVASGGPTRADSAVMSVVEQHRSESVTAVVSVLTELFSPVLVPVWALCLAGYLLFRDRRVQRTATVLSAVVGAGAVAEVIKLIVGRPRPPAIDQLTAYEATLSYPSGHVTGTAAMLVAIALICAVRSRAARVAAVAAAIVVTVIVAWTRLYMGVHWLTDVAAGLVVGAATAALAAVIVPAAIGWIVSHAGTRIPDPIAAWLTPSVELDTHHAIGAPQ